MLERILAEIKDSISVKQKTFDNPQTLKFLSKTITSCVKSLQNEGKIIFCGNGGSFADAQHLSAELTSRFKFDRASLPSLALGTNNSAISAIGNDYGFDEVFGRELSSIGKINDILIAITTSGNSKNILNVVNKAEQLGIEYFVLSGGHGGKIKNKKNLLLVDSSETARIQECHILVGHIICGEIERALFKTKSLI